MKHSQLKSETSHDQDIDFFPEVYSKPAVLFMLAIGIVFFAEFLVMLLLARLPKLEPVVEALVDASLLSSFIVPALYLFVYRPLKENISKRQRTEAEQQQMLEVDRIKSQFISTAAHELGTPLTSVMGYSELLLSSVELTEDERRAYQQTIYDKSMVLERLIDDLLDLSRIDSGQVVRLEMDEHLLLPIVESVVHFFQCSMPDRKIETVLPIEVPPMQIDAVRIGQVLENLISNAIKYSPDGGQVKVKVAKAHQEICVTVTDQGLGMTPPQLDRVFEKFYRVDNSDTATGGLGLGMTIVKEIVEGHGGSVRVDSVYNQGTSVQVTLPRNSVSHAMK
jgi:signal transduction histidine kinase